MPRKTALRAVKSGEKPPVPTPKTIKEAAELGERALLVAMRAKVAAEIDAGVPAHALAPLMRQLRDVDKEVRLLDSRDEQEATRSGPTADEKWTAI